MVVSRSSFTASFLDLCCLVDRGSHHKIAPRGGRTASRYSELKFSTPRWLAQVDRHGPAPATRTGLEVAIRRAHVSSIRSGALCFLTRAASSSSIFEVALEGTTLLQRNCAMDRAKSLDSAPSCFPSRLARSAKDREDGQNGEANWNGHRAPRL